MSEDTNGTKKKGFFSLLREGLSRTREALASKVDNLISYYKEMDDDFFDDLLDILISSDLGINTAEDIVASVRNRVRKEKVGDSQRVHQYIREAIVDELGGVQEYILPKPVIVTMVGVNGTGKTTTAGKLAAKFQREGRSVVLAAADTFRAAAAEQLSVWGERANVPVIRHQEGSDPAAVVFDAISSFKAREADILLADTAGRLHNKKNLMNELEKIGRIIEREAPDIAHEVFLVVDATTGQNALNQARVFSEVAHVTGIILTKLDSTAKGGIAIAIASELKVPVRYVGVGEGIDDLMPFDPESYAKSIL